MIKRGIIQPLAIALFSLISVFLFFIFSQYYRPIFAIRIFILDTIGLLMASILYNIIQPKYTSILKRTLLIIFTYFCCYELADTLIYFFKHHSFSRSRTDFVEAQTAAYTIIIAFVIAGAIRLSDGLKNNESRQE
jgi:hypothetical protein